MRKFCFILMALLCTTAMFIGCSDDDDDDNGNGQGAGNGGSGVMVLPKKVSKIVTSHNGLQAMTDLFAYDAKGRLTKITDTEYGDKREYITNITYGDNKITLSKGDEPSVITLKDGKAISYIDYDGSNRRSEYTYTYSGKYLSKAVCKDFKKNNDTWENDGSDEANYTVKDGNLLNMVYSYNNGIDDTGKGTITYEMSNIDNNTNIDLYGYVMAEDVFLLCAVGDRSKKLPAKVVDQEEGEEADVTTYTYKTDKEGYITEITETEDDGKYVTEYAITYE